MPATDPARREHAIRLAISLFGLALMTLAILRSGFQGHAWIEVAAIGTLFFGGSALWSGSRLLKRSRE